MNANLLFICFVILGIWACKQAPKSSTQAPKPALLPPGSEILHEEFAKTEKGKPETNLKPQKIIPIQEDFERSLCEDSHGSRWSYQAYSKKDRVDQVFIDPHNSEVYLAYKKVLSDSVAEKLNIKHQAYLYELVSEKGDRFSVKPGNRVLHIEKEHVFTQRGEDSEEYFGGLLIGSKYKIEQNELSFVDSVVYMGEENPWNWKGPEVFLPAAAVTSFAKKGDSTVELAYKKLKSGTRVRITDIRDMTLIDIRKKDTSIYPLTFPDNKATDLENIGGPTATYLLSTEILVFSITIKDRFSYRLLSFDLGGEFQWEIPVDYMNVPFKSSLPLDVIDDPINNQAIICNRVWRENRKIFHTVGAINKQDGSYLWKLMIDADTSWKSPDPKIKGYGTRVHQMFRIDVDRIGLIYAQLTGEGKDTGPALYRDGRLLLVNTNGKILCEQTIDQPFRFLKVRVKNGHIDIFSDSGRWSLGIEK